MRSTCTAIGGCWPSHPGFIFIAVLVAFVAKPIPWYGRIEMGGALYVVVGWTYGAVALAAAVVALGIAISALREHRAR
jgi:hypothetical protein